MQVRSQWVDKYPRRTARVRVYVFPADEAVLANFVARFNRPIALYRKAAKQALDQLGMTDVTLSWSQKAGCRCGCSPGFLTSRYGMSDLYVTISADAEHADEQVRSVGALPPERIEAAMRIATGLG